ncbi:hypothetical protein [Desulfobacula sp.]|uniref:rhamnosyltransferase WsaF family glycosyltransferase n=1 Tax=Desulfobacula sp. TaxID=2593537 RepID=UPI0025BC07BC|nr:hypothetical protein [Desulfobacula sp.]MBC2704929.1 hypothetical protein [Desulfobacula sp.]
MLIKLSHKLVNYIRRNSFLKEKVKNIAQPLITSAMNAGIPEITPLNVRQTTDSRPRINILVPSINQEHIFGGISTALLFFDRFAGFTRIRKRIITTDTMPDAEAAVLFNEYKIMSCTEDSRYDNEIVGFGDRHGKTIPVGENDCFIATAWWTAFHAQKIIRWQQATYAKPVKKMIYFIQDFEPGFYPWSSRYALSDSTYHFEYPQVAVFNSSMLHTFFKDNHYEFDIEFVFEPVLNEKLKKGLDDTRSFNKKKQILIYGRPSVDRNAFSSIVEAFKVWVWQQPDVHDWQLISVGEQHPDIELGNKMILSSIGKLPLEGYVDVLRESAVGISLMVSPHPSYPPMEMAMFGIGVISNTYANKQLSDWHENIHSIDLSVDNLVKAMEDICGRFAKDSGCFSGSGKRLLKKEYMEPDGQFDFIEQLVHLW